MDGLLYEAELVAAIADCRDHLEQMRPFAEHCLKLAEGKKGLTARYWRRQAAKTEKVMFRQAFRLKELERELEAHREYNSDEAVAEQFLRGEIDLG